MNDNYLEAYADDNFSGFEGEQDLLAYTGEGDDFLDFDGPSQSFANQGELQRAFSITIQNPGDTMKKVVLFNGYREKTDSGEILFNDGDTLGPIPASGEPTILLKSSCSPGSIADLRSFLKQNPAVLGFLRISSTNPQQMEQTLSISELSPFKDLGTREIFLAQYVNENTFRDNMVTVPTPNLIVGNETKISINILGNSTMTITLFFGGLISQSVALKNKYRKAVSNITAVGLPNVLRSQKIRKGLPQ